MNKLFKRIAISLISLVLVYTGLRIYLNYVLKKVIIDQVEHYADKNYKLEIGAIDIGIWAYNANIKGLVLSTVIKKETLNNQYHFTLSAKRVKLRGLYLIDLLFYQKLELKKLLIVDPLIVINYNDTLAVKPKKDSVFFDFYYKLSNITFQNAEIHVNKSSGEKFKLKSKLLDYNLEAASLKINQIQFETKNSRNYNFDYLCKISKASLNGFDVNTLMNDMNFNYSNCKVDTLDVKLFAHDYVQVKRKRKSELLERIKSKSNTTINELKIKDIKFYYQSKYDIIKISAQDFNYNKHDLSLENIHLLLQQQHTIESQIDKIAITGFNVDRFIAQKHCSVNKMTIINPSVKTRLMEQEAYSKLVKIAPQDIGYQIDLVREFELKNGSLTLNHAKYKNFKLDVKSVGFVAKDLNLHYFDDTDHQQLLGALDLKSGPVFLNFTNNIYHLNLKNIDYNLKQESLNIYGVRIASNYSRKQFPKVVKKQIAMVTLDLKKIGATQINVNKLLNINAFECDQISAHEATVSFYKDKNVALLESDYKKFPQELIHEINYPIFINDIKFYKSTIINEILNPGASNIAVIKIDNVEANLQHIENKKYKGNVMKVFFSGRLAGAGMLKANATLDMYASDFRHTVHAEIGKMPFKYLNDFMFDFAGVEINKGTLDKAVLDIKGNHKKLDSKLDLSYHDLSMDILRNKNRKHKKYRSIASILANSIIYNSNPEPGKALRKSEVTQDYISNKFIVGNWIHVSLKAMLLTSAPSAANALQIINISNSNDSTVDLNRPKWLKRFLERKKIK